MKFEFSDVTPIAYSHETLEAAIKSDSRWVIVAYGDFLDLREKILRIKRTRKRIFVKLGEIEGLREESDATMRYLTKELGVDGIISNKTKVLMKGKKAGLITVYTAFILDTKAFMTSFKNIKNIKPDIVELRPGLIPKVIREFRRKSDIPVWATGLISERSEVEELKRAGASSVVASRDYLW